jgi:hypothetical protein
MREVNDFNLAYAVHKAGCFPSFFFQTTDDIIKYRTEIDNNFNVFAGLDFRFTEKHMDVILDVCPKILEITWGDPANKKEILENKKLVSFFERLKLKGTQLFFREISPVDSIESIFDGINIKGKESAGSAGLFPTKINFLKQQQLLPNTKIIITGGIYHPDSIKWYIENGAYAVCIGTPFALTKESKVNHDVKKKLITSNKSNIKEFYLNVDLKFDTAKRNAIQLGNITKNDNLKDGVNGNGGLIYSGYAIEHINQIISVQELVNYMTSSLTL